MTISFLKSADWQEAKAFLIAQLVDKPLNIKTSGMSNEQIALEVRASQLANDKCIKMIRRLERSITEERKKSEPFR